MIRHFVSGRFLGFVAVGAVAATTNWSVRALFGFWWPFPLAVAVGYAAGMSCAFVLNRRFVFTESDEPVAHQLRMFVLTNLSMAPVVFLSAIFINQRLIDAGFVRHSENLAHAIAIVIPAALTFLSYKFIAFRSRSP